MPNWCNNNLTIVGEKNQLNDFFEKAKSENSDLTFNNIFPRPKSLDITSGGNVDNAAAYIKYTENGDDEGLKEMLDWGWVKERKIDTLEKLVEYLKSDLSEKDLKEGRMSIENLEKYGYKDWYNWNCDNWGTKWDACDVDILEKTDELVRYYFNTAWAPPVQFFIEASKLYPELEFQCEWGGPEMDGEGSITIKNGEVISDEYTEHNEEYYR